MFVADEGMKLGNFDAEQGESRVVGAIEWNLFKRGDYLDACESGDLHTAVARICWPDLPWTDDSGRRSGAGGSNLIIDITLDASCARSLATALTTAADLQHLPLKLRLIFRSS